MTKVLLDTDTAAVKSALSLSGDAVGTTDTQTLIIDDTPRARFFIRDGASNLNAANSSVTITTGSWFYLAARVDNTAKTIEVRINTTDSSTTSFTATNNGTNAFTVGVGGLSSTGAYFDGVIDEHRLRQSYLSDNWLTTEYNNQSDHSTFATIGAEETDGGGGGATFNNFKGFGGL